MPETSTARRPRRRLAYLLGSAMLIAGLGCGGAAQAAVVGTAPAGGTAHSAPAPGPCQVKSGWTSIVQRNGQPLGGTTYRKPFTRCRDLNLTYVGASGYYTGWVHPDSRWHRCSARPVWVWAGSHPRAVVLCRGVAPGTVLTVTSAIPRHIAIRVLL
jgi:hypothetical protein